MNVHDFISPDYYWVNISIDTLYIAALSAAQNKTKTSAS